MGYLQLTPLKKDIYLESYQGFICCLLFCLSVGRQLNRCECSIFFFTEFDTRERQKSFQKTALYLYMRYTKFNRNYGKHGERQKDSDIGECWKKLAASLCSSLTWAMLWEKKILAIVLAWFHYKCCFLGILWIKVSCHRSIIMIFSAFVF